MATNKQLRERWRTEEGKKIKKKIIENSRGVKWEKFLRDFPYSYEVKNNRDLRWINLSFEDFEKIKFKYLEKGELVGPDFSYADLTGADFLSAKLMNSDFEGSIIKDTKFHASLIMGSNFKNSIVNNSSFLSANLWGSNFNSAIIRDSDFNGCNLSNVDLSNAEISNCYIYGISAWEIKRNDSTKTNNLIITRRFSKGAEINVDDIELAQFISLIMDNKKISNLINSMRTKSVLILGSFNNKTKLVLDRIKEVLPNYNLIPIVFDFIPSEKQDLIETVKTIALLSSFVIVDLSIPAGQLHELASIVRETYIPFATIADKDSKQTIMLNEFRHQYWFRSDKFMYSIEKYKEQIPSLLENEIIPWVKEINNRLAEERKNI